MPKKATIRTRQRGKTFSYSFDAGKHPVTGRRKVIEKGGFETAQEAYDAGVAAYTNWKSGNIGLTSEKVLLKDYLHMWLENVSRPQVKRSTYLSYAYHITHNINPYIGDIVLQELRPRDCAELMKKLVDRGLHRSTLSSTRNVLSSALKYAIYPAEIIITNAAANITIPKNVTDTSQVKRTVISSEQIQAILHDWPFGSKLYMPILISYHTGMRISEVLGLEWDAIDFTAKTIHVRQGQCFSRAARRSYLDTPKTKKSDRTILVDTGLLNELLRWKKQQATNRLTKGTTYQTIFTDKDRFLFTQSVSLPPSPSTIAHDMVCTDDHGRIVSYSSLSDILRKNYGFNTHSFRHTHATKLIEAGAKPVAVAARLGHTDATITQNLYTHDTEAMQKETLTIFEKSL